MKSQNLLNQYADRIHTLNRDWWVNLDTGKYEPEKRDKATAVNLFHAEVSEMLEAIRKPIDKDTPKPSSKIKGFTEEAEELADLVIRCFDYAGGHDLDMQVDEEWDKESLKEIGEALSVLVSRERPEINTYTKMQLIGYIHYAISQMSHVVFNPSPDSEALSIGSILALAMIYSLRFDIPLEEAIEAKLEYNANRADHKIENRKASGGKKL